MPGKALSEYMPTQSKVGKYTSLTFAFLFGVFFTGLFGVVNVYAHGQVDLIRACVNNHSGEIHILLGNKKCGRNEKVLEWNKLGPQGPQGIQGPAGQDGSGSGALSKSGVFVVKGTANSNFVCSGTNGSGTDCFEHEIPIPSSGKLVTLAVNPYRNSNVTGGPANITVLVNGLPTALHADISAGSLSVVIINEDIPVQSGDLITVQSHDSTGDGSTSFIATIQYSID